LPGHSEEAGVPIENTIVGAAHTFSPPHSFFGSLTGYNAGDEGPALSPGMPAYSMAIDDAVGTAITQRHFRRLFP
jgi:hypothetical protein